MNIKVGLEYVGYVDPWTDEERLSDEEIVRCRDCDYSSHFRAWLTPSKRSSVETWTCGNMAEGFEVEPDGFCAWGKRRDA